MRIHLKCSCGAEAMWCNDEDSDVDHYHMESYSDVWMNEHAKCREAARLLKMSDDGSVEPVFPKPEPAKACEHVYPAQGVPRCIHCGEEFPL